MRQSQNLRQSLRQSATMSILRLHHTSQLNLARWSQNCDQFCDRERESELRRLIAECSIASEFFVRKQSTEVSITFTVSFEWFWWYVTSTMWGFWSVELKSSRSFELVVVFVEWLWGFGSWLSSVVSGTQLAYLNLSDVEREVDSECRGLGYGGDLNRL